MKQKKNFGDRVRELREHYGKSQQEFASLIGMKSYQGLYKIETGSTLTPQASTINKIISVFGTTRDWLLYEVGEMLPDGDVKLHDESSQDTGVYINPYRDYLVQKLEGEIAFYRQLLNNMTGGKAANFLQALNGTGLRKRRSLGAAA